MSDGALYGQHKGAQTQFGRRKVHLMQLIEEGMHAAVSDHGQEDIVRTVSLREELDRLLPGFPLQPQSNGMSAYFFGSGNGNSSSSLNR